MTGLALGISLPSPPHPAAADFLPAGRRNCGTRPPKPAKVYWRDGQPRCRFDLLCRIVKRCFRIGIATAKYFVCVAL